MIKNFGIEIIVDASFFSDSYVEALLWRIIDAGIQECARCIEKAPVVPSVNYDVTKTHVTRLHRVYFSEECESCFPNFIGTLHRTYVLETHILPDLFSATEKYLLVLMQNIIDNGIKALKNTSKENENIKTITIGTPFIVFKK